LVFLGLILETQLVLNLLQDLGDVFLDLLVHLQSAVKVDVLAVAVRTALLMEHHVKTTTYALKDVDFVVFVLFLYAVKICKDLRLSLGVERNQGYCLGVWDNSSLNLFFLG
jgi:hypothetical protein